MSATEGDRLRTRYGAWSRRPPTLLRTPMNVGAVPGVQHRARTVCRRATAPRRQLRPQPQRARRRAQLQGLSSGRPTSTWPQALPGFRDVPIYPPGGDLTRARRLAESPPSPRRPDRRQERTVPAARADRAVRPRQDRHRRRHPGAVGYRQFQAASFRGRLGPCTHGLDPRLRRPLPTSSSTRCYEAAICPPRSP